jgi:tRNA modification GTPase
MPRQSLEETIIAVSTPPGVGGIGIVRMSGPEALPLALRIFKPRRANRAVLPFRTILGDLVGQGGRRFDEAFLTYFKAPRSYTREDVVELSCHGSPAVLEETVRLGVRAGARRAHPGEFTRRAFLHGRIDILQAEAVQSLVESSSLSTARIAYGQLRHGLSNRLDSFRAEVLTLLADIEADLEFPDESVGVSRSGIEASLGRALRFVGDLIESHQAGRLMTEGYTLAIVGRPNVGKSTLFNALSGKSRAIVTPYPGTTRDFLEEKVRVGDAVFNLVDMAGMGGAGGPIEREGVQIGKEIAGRADGVLYVVDASRKDARADLRLARGHARAKSIVVFNKSDLPARIDKAAIIAAAGGAPSVDVSALKGAHMDALIRAIKSRFAPHRKRYEDVILHSRQRILLEQIRDRLEAASRLAREGYGLELCAEEVRAVVSLLGRLTGGIRTEDVLKSIFDRFCIGK